MARETTVKLNTKVGVETTTTTTREVGAGSIPHKRYPLYYHVLAIVYTLRPVLLLLTDATTVPPSNAVMPTYCCQVRAIYAT